MEVKSSPRGISGQSSFLSIKLNTQANLRVCLFVGDLTITKKANNKVEGCISYERSDPTQVLDYQVSHKSPCSIT